MFRITPRLLVRGVAAVAVTVAVYWGLTRPPMATHHGVHRAAIVTPLPITTMRTAPVQLDHHGPQASVTAASHAFDAAMRYRFVPHGSGVNFERTTSGRGREVISIDETGPNGYYESRDLEAWQIMLGTREYAIKAGWPRPFDSATLEEHPRLTILLCMSMAATDTKCIRPPRLATLPGHFRVSQIPGLRDTLWRKDAYCKTINDAISSATAAIGPWIRSGLMQHVIQCWRYPEEIAELREYFDAGGPMVIVKPSTRGEGRGIYTALTLDAIVAEGNDPASRVHGGGRVVQKMELSPALIQGRKFDLRCYVFITSMQPLRLYLWRDGLVRLAATKYNLSQIKGSEHRESWMTNTFINKAFANVNNLTLSFSQMTEELREQGVGGRKLWDDIHAAIVDTFLLGEVAMARYVHAKLAGRPCTQCFQLLGVDVLLDGNFKPTVIEVNGLPSMQLSHEKGAPVDTTQRYTRMKLQLLDNAIDMLTLNCTLPPGRVRNAVLELVPAAVPAGESGTEPPDSATLAYLVAAVCEQTHANGFTRLFPAVAQAETTGPRHLRAFLKWSAMEVRALTPTGVQPLLTNAAVVSTVLPKLELVAGLHRSRPHQ